MKDELLKIINEIKENILSYQSQSLSADYVIDQTYESIIEMEDILLDGGSATDDYFDDEYDFD